MLEHPTARDTLTKRQTVGPPAGVRVSRFEARVSFLLAHLVPPRLPRCKQGRYKVRDPRLFDPCSMCRRPDTAATVTPTLTPLLGAGAGSRGDGGGSASGVTLLLGCRVENGAGGDRTGDNKGEGTEQVG